MGTVVYLHSGEGTYSPWWHPSNPKTQSPWQRCQGWWWGWRPRATGRRAKEWRSCPETRRARGRHPTTRIHPAETNSLIWTFNFVLMLCHIDMCVYVCTQKNRLKRKSMYLMQQMQPRAMTESTNTARNKIGQNVNILKEVIASIWYYCTCMQIPSEGRKE